MASSGSLGTLNAKIRTPLQCGTRRAIGILPVNSSWALTAKKSLQQHTRLRLTSTRPWKVLNFVSNSSLETPLSLEDDNDDDDGEESKYSGSRSKLSLNFDEVENLLTTICDTTSIAQVELKVGGFRLNMMRKVDPPVVVAPRPPPSPEPTSSYEITATPHLNGSVSTPSLAIVKANEPFPKNTEALLDKAADEGLVMVKSTKVGFFRRCRTIKGKRAPPPCEENQLVREGQAVCYVEQLGGVIPMETEVAGEVIRILKEDGDAVGYGDPLIAILPSFPGIKKLN